MATSLPRSWISCILNLCGVISEARPLSVVPWLLEQEVSKELEMIRKKMILEILIVMAIFLNKVIKSVFVQQLKINATDSQIIIKYFLISDQ